MSNSILFPVVFSNSLIQSFWSCDLKGFRSGIQHLVGAGSNPDLIAGSIFASAIELARRAYYEKELSQEECIELAEEFILTSEDTGHLIKTNERIALTFKKYVKTFPFTKDFLPCKLPNGKFAIEYQFTLDTGIEHPDLPGINITYKGMLDGLYEKVYQGKIAARYVLDEKTTARVSRIPNSKCALYPNGVVDLERESDIFRASSQLIAYAFASDKLGTPVTSGVIRRVPILTKHEDAYELHIPITRFMKDQWAASTFEKIAELKDRYIYYRDKMQGVKGQTPHSVFYPTYSGSCNAYNRPCQYIEGCLTKHGEKILEQTHIQAVTVLEENGDRTRVALEEYKANLGLQN